MEITEQTTDSIIREHEEQLRSAMLKSDVNILDRLLAPNLIFTNHFGQLMTKQDDLAAHASGKLNIEAIEPSDYRSILCDDVAIVNVKVTITGSYEAVSSTQDFRFTRVWKRVSGDVFQLVAGHSCVVV